MTSIDASHTVPGVLSGTTGSIVGASGVQAAAVLTSSASLSKTTLGTAVVTEDELDGDGVTTVPGAAPKAAAEAAIALHAAEQAHEQRALEAKARKEADLRARMPAEFESWQARNPGGSPEEFAAAREHAARKLLDKVTRQVARLKRAA